MALDNPLPLVGCALRSHRSWPAVAHGLALAALIGFGGCQLATPQTDPASGGWTQAVSRSIKSTGSQLARALEVPAQTTAAHDPASLDNLPDRVDAIVYVQFAHAAEEHGNPAAARQYFEKAADCEPANLSVLIAYARFCDRHQLTETALAAYQQARDADPHCPLVPNDLGLLHARRGQLPQALEHLQLAVALQPQSVRYRNNLAQVLLALDRPDTAVQTLAAVLPPAGAHYNVACLLQQQGRSHESFLHLTRAVELDPSYGPALDMLARSHAQTSIASTAGPPRM